MKKIILFVFTFCFVQITFAQRHEIGIFAGGANVIGDIGKANYINPFPNRLEKGGKLFFPISIGGLYRFNINPYMGFRLNLSYSRVGAGDHSSEQYKIDRNKFFKNNIFEGSVMFEYNFFNINESLKTAQSPYIFVGVGAFSAKSKEYDYDSSPTAEFPNGKIIEQEKYKTNFTIPMGVGYKFRFNYNWILSLETGIRYTNVDYIDYSTGKFSERFSDAINSGDLSGEEYDKRKFGNISNKDWYVLTGFTLTYSFGRPACYCN